MPLSLALPSPFFKGRGEYLLLLTNLPCWFKSRLLGQMERTAISKAKLLYPCVAQNLAVQGGDVSGSDLLASKYAHC
jgi:hypothetical protein